MSTKDVCCEFCDTPFDGERDENGVLFCECSGAIAARLTKAIERAIDLLEVTDDAIAIIVRSNLQKILRGN